MVEDKKMDREVNEDDYRHYSLVSKIVNPLNEDILIKYRVRNFFTKKKYIIFIFNMCFYYLFANELIKVGDIPNWLQKIEFLMPKIDYILSLVSNPNKVRFGLAWFWLVWCISEAIDFFIDLIKLKNVLKKDSQRLDVKKINKKDIKTIIFMILGMLLFSYGYTISYEYWVLIYGGVLSIFFENIWLLPTLPQWLFVAIIGIVRLSIIQTAISILHYIFYKIFRRNRELGV